MSSIPRSTITSTLALVGIGLTLVIVVLILAFSILGEAGSNEIDPLPTTSETFATPTPEFFPNEPLLDNESGLETSL